MKSIIAFGVVAKACAMLAEICIWLMGLSNSRSLKDANALPARSTKRSSLVDLDHGFVATRITLRLPQLPVRTGVALVECSTPTYRQRAEDQQDRKRRDHYTIAAGLIEDPPGYDRADRRPSRKEDPCDSNHRSETLETERFNHHQRHLHAEGARGKTTSDYGCRKSSGCDAVNMPIIPSAARI